MSVLKSVALSAVGAIFLASSAGADTFEKYGEVEGWKVFADNEKQSCLIEAVDAAENVVQMGLTSDKSAAYVGVFTKAKTDIKSGDKEAVVIDIDGDLYVGEATGMRGNITKGYSGGYVLSDDPKFVEDVAKKYIMTVFPEKEYAFSVNLAGTYKAIEMVKKCNAELNG
ncbi:hypothetical protein [Sedimentitalea nanhaiensis]|uniref:Invasion protein IalB, involved in pathogenesis n=1 Tax=Sedimentitalea nanhaiensis TaxID=999627 RepID=A0A1I6Z2P2_9RHOB|nr:hypothetical protein [Sedimentitalea nanhaiensis]SFT56868.1 hypothetical protein SAMN05216236_103183 [Sedimentitalea nanhaiensis]